MIEHDDLTYVDGHPELARTSSGAIVNTSKSDYELFLENKRKKLQQQKRIDSLEEKMDSLENKLDSIIDILSKGR